MKGYTFFFLCLLFTTCKQTKEIQASKSKAEFISSSVCSCDTISQKRIEKLILPFVDCTYIQQDVKVFKIFTGRRYYYTRVNVFATKYYDNWDNNLPCSYREYKNSILLFYNGNENLVDLDSNYKKMLLAKLEVKTIKDYKLYNGRVLQIDFYSKDSMLVNLPAQNPLDFDCEPQQVIYDFSPPKRKKK
jgi:hypothetical protein